MNRLLPLIFLGVALFVGLNKAYAQPTVYVDPGYVLIDSLEQTCVAFKTADFTDIQEMRFTVRWNPEALNLVDIPLGSLNPNMTGLDISDFTVDQTEGFVIFTWKVENIPGCPTSDVTLFPDDQTLFELCFEGVQGYSEILITDDPEDIYVTRTNSCPLNIGLFSSDGFIAVDNQPLTINVPYVNANNGETVCMDFTVENFTNIVSLQFSVNWYPSVLSFVSWQGLNLPGWTSGNANVNQAEGWATFSWFNPDPTQGFSAPDGTAIIQLCFEVTGSCGQTSPVSITSNPTGIEITYDNDPGVDIGVLNGDGAVSVNCFNPNGMSINIPDVSICPGESFCMDVTADNFNDLVGMQFSLNWNPDVIQFTGISNINSSLFTFDINDFNTAGAVNNGYITVDWADPSCFGETLTDGSTLFTICFQSVGGGDVNTTVAVTSTPLQIEVLEQCFGNNIPPNTYNGFVDVCQLPGVVLVAGSATANPGEQVCVDVDVQQFDAVENLQFSVIWETSVLDYTGVTNFGLPGLSAANFDENFTNFGAICLTWSPPSGIGETLPDGSAIFSICFTAIGDPFECSSISFTEFPCLIDVVTSESNGTNVGIDPVEGEICMLNPYQFGITPTSIDGFQNTIVCVDFEVSNFVSLGELIFSINWDPNVLLYTEINNQNLPGFTAASYNDAQASFGFLSVIYQTPLGNPVSLPNGTSIFEVCFIVIGDPGQCSPITISGVPQPIEIYPASAPTTNIGLVTTPGEVCSSQFLQILSADITGVDCSGDNSGAIDITVTGGSGVYSYNWSVPPPNNTSEDQVNLTNGTYFVTVQDNIYGNLTLIDTLVVGLSPNAPIADAGDDTIFPCGEIAMDLDGSGSSQGGQYTYLWTPLTGGSIAPGENTILTPTIVGAGEYELAVTDQTSGCTTLDTISIAVAVSPGAAASVSGPINCQTDTVQLSGLGSTTGPNITYAWSTPDGTFGSGNVDSLLIEAVAGGTYYFEVTNINSGCSTLDSVVVVVDTLHPMAIASPDTSFITCSQNNVGLSGVGSSTGANIAYQWLDPDGTPISSNISTTASEPGVYQFIVSNINNFCQANDSALVIADVQVPTVVTMASSKINCLVDTVTLLGTGSSTGNPGDFTYLWTGPAGGIVPGTETLINAQCTLPGPYALTVVNTSNDCQALSVVLVTKDTLAPIAVASAPQSLSCNVTEVPLNGTGSSTGVAGAFTYLWTGPLVKPGTEANLNATAQAPGLYTLTVTRTSNGCVGTATINVPDISDVPIAVIAAPGIIDCNNDFVILDATGSSQGPTYTYTWSGPFCINTTNPLLPQVGCAGCFTLTVTNTATGCKSTAEVCVDEDTNQPVAIAQNSSFTCLDSEIQLDGTASSQGPLFTYQWTAIPPNSASITGGGTTLTPTVNGPGSYGLEVMNTQNGCVATDIAFVMADTLPPNVNAGMDTEITCNDPTANLSGTTGPNVTFQWYLDGNPISGATMITYAASEPGTYTLEATSNLNGCVGTDDVVVNPNNQPPLTSAGPDQELGCEDVSVALDGSGSASGPNISYLWTTSGGVLDPGTITNPSAIAEEAGFYVLTVSDAVTGCSGTDTVEVVMVIGLPDASFSFDSDPCATDAALIGNLPEGTTGVWTVNTSADFQDPNDPNTTVFNLAPGTNVVTWTLSSPNCPNYSSSTGEVTIEGKPIANNDIGLIDQQDVESVEIDLLANDLLLGIDNYVLNIIPFGGPGTVEPANPLDGVVTYFASPLFAGQVQFLYELCNDACLNLCDTAFVRVTIDKNIDLNNSVPNGITPNGDGANDVFIFDILLANPDRYPDNELVIFNRWGDIVFQASPYNNDWDGNSSNGPLPAGTYYYILRLDVNDGLIIRGDVTIVR
ncbi:MAG: gliding motility-associated C-terminal domain-containing protein [Lewinellaceae bacterium]|nr:gliding motility-associated C-terminal domain-containing protein [Lewinellaceae bacterium]